MQASARSLAIALAASFVAESCLRRILHNFCSPPLPVFDSFDSLAWQYGLYFTHGKGTVDA